jgi:hypothetical protein
MSEAAKGTRRRSVRGGRLTLLLLLLALAVPASSQATWSTPVTLSAAGTNGFDSQVGIDQNGNAVAVWRDGLIRARARSEAGTLSAIQTLSESGEVALEPQVAVDPNGNAVFVWDRYDGSTDCGGGKPPSAGCRRVQARARSSTGTLSTIQTLSDAGMRATFPGVGIDQNGNSVFSWQVLSPAIVQASARSSTGTLSAVQTLSMGPASLPQVAVDPNGNAVFVWVRRDGTTDCGGSGCFRIRAVARTAAGVLSTVQTLSPAAQNATNPQVGVDQSGNAVFVWTLLGGSTDAIQTRARSAAGTLSATQTLSTSSLGESNPQVAVDPNGNAVFTWQRYDGTATCGARGCFRAQARARSAGGVLSSIQTLSPGGQHAGGQQVGGDQNGNAVFVWGRRDATTQCDFGSSGCDRVQARTRSSGGVLGTVQTLSAPGQHARSPQVAVDPGGNAVAVWGRYDGTNWRIQAAAGP